MMRHVHIQGVLKNFSKQVFIGSKIVDSMKGVVTIFQSLQERFRAVAACIVVDMTRGWSFQAHSEIQARPFHVLNSIMVTSSEKIIERAIF